jgi:hypothetical protein
MKYADEMGSGAIIYILSFIKNGSAIQKLGGWDSQIDRHLISFHLYFFKIRKVG